MIFTDKYEFSNFIKKGQFGDFYECFHKETGSRFAVKIKSVNRYNDEGSNNAYADLEESREIAIWRRLKHRHVLELLDISKTPTHHYLVTEYFIENNLLDEIAELTTYTESDICYYIKQILKGLLYFREKRIIHRNIKIENIFLQRSSSDEIVKIADFGLAVRLKKGQKNASVEACGSPLFLAPEIILEKPISYAVDLWSVGVILYIMLIGSPPFWNEFPERLYFDIITKEINSLLPIWENVSQNAKEFLKGALDKNSRKRTNVKHALNHTWFKSQTKPKIHRSQVVESLKSFNAKQKLNGELFKFQKVTYLTLSQNSSSTQKESFHRQTAIVSEVNYMKIDERRQISKLNITFHPIKLQIDLNELDL